MRILLILNLELTVDLPSIRLLKHSGWLLVETRMRLMACHQERRVKARVTLNQLKMLILSPPFEPRRPKSAQPSHVLPKNPRSDVRNMQESGQKQQLRFSCYCCYYNLNVQHLNQAVQSHYGLLALNIVISEPLDGLQAARLSFLLSGASHMQGWSLWFCQELL